MTSLRVAVAVAAALALAGCGTTGTGGAGPTTTAPTTGTTTGTTAGGTARAAACADLVDKGQALLVEVGRYVRGAATADQVHAAAAALSASFDSARSAIGPEARADLDNAGQALREVLDALTAQPVDKDRLRTAAGQVVSALGDAAAVCATGTPTASTPPVATTS